MKDIISFDITPSSVSIEKDFITNCNYLVIVQIYLTAPILCIKWYCFPAPMCDNAHHISFCAWNTSAVQPEGMGRCHKKIGKIQFNSHVLFCSVFCFAHVFA
jgi:hypothetical protein